MLHHPSPATFCCFPHLLPNSFLKKACASPCLAQENGHLQSQPKSIQNPRKWGLAQSHVGPRRHVSCGGRGARQGKGALCLERSLALPTTLDAFVFVQSTSLFLGFRDVHRCKGGLLVRLFFGGGARQWKSLENRQGKLAPGSNLL